MATCRHKVGLLSLRDCGKTVVSQCTNCNRSVCKKHRKIVTIKGKDEACCVECYLQQVSEEKAMDEGIGREYHRRGLYHSMGYGYDDYNSFDRETEAEYGVAEDVMDAEDFQGS
ncbi:MAG: hypothetical protein GY862_33450 [Gammaproteobacteria bacterium]|nr:hypothetical protein [Gammaproteobacteria bacterium]